MTVYFQRGSSGELALDLQGLVDVYRRVFHLPPYQKTENEIEEFEAFLPVHARQPGFRIVGAAESGYHRVVGFAYGRQLTPNLPWFEIVIPQIMQANIDRWTNNAYQLVEIAVDPQFQRNGIGGQLHDRLISDLPYQHILLSTMVGNTPAQKFYKNRGWEPLVESLIVPGISRKYQVMGLEVNSPNVTSRNETLENK
jgi:ribosomal protein S18 acetylase RimI-like enzyme